MDILHGPRARRRLGRMVALLATLLLGGVAACGQQEKADTTPDVVRFGALVPLTGDNAPTGQRLLEAFQIAVKDVNDAGGVLGRKVELVVGDDACDPGTAVVKANEMAGRDITVSVGGGCSVAAVPTLKVFRTAGIPMIIPAANSTDLLAPGYDSVFLLAGTTTLEADRAVDAMEKLGRQRLLVIDDGTSFPQTVAAAAVASVQKRGGPLELAGQMKISQGATSYPRVLDKINEVQADLVFFTGYYPEAGRMIRDLRDGGYQGTIMLSDAGTDPTLFDVLDAKQSENVYGITLPLAQFDPKAKEWAAKYRASYGHEPGPFTMQGYDAVRLAANAVARAGTTDHEAVRKAIADTKPADIDLLSGPAEFTPNGTQPHPTFILLQIKNDAFVLVSEVN
ncbi:branched-chain amino acid ABC transporter substrate-binding protein [Catellatospora methionotrophica]|uniref:branched-chain amino acid ABC transporter substrate-binding protein n=1 Tax=Catellatospora methionotrophica TaxID=121620 RepID=UPI003400FC32